MMYYFRNLKGQADRKNYRWLHGTLLWHLTPYKNALLSAFLYGFYVVSSQLAQFRRSVQTTNFVTVRFAHIAQVQPADRAIAPTRWVFAGGAAISNACGMKSVALLRRLHGKADGAAIAVRGLFAVDGCGDT